MLTIQPNARTAHLFLFLQDLVLDLDGDVTRVELGCHDPLHRFEDAWRFEASRRDAGIRRGH
jgi:hypothetical protein